MCVIDLLFLQKLRIMETFLLVMHAPAVDAIFCFLRVFTVPIRGISAYK